MTAILLFSALLTANTYGSTQDNTQALANKLHLYGGQKAVIQWKRVFSSPRHLKKYKLDTLDAKTRERLQRYLVEHAADSDQPIVPGL